MSVRIQDDERIVMTLDAGGTNLKFSAIQANRLLLEPISIPSEATSLDRCLANIVSGFEQVRAALPKAPVAISFAFPGPADYPAGVITNIGNLPAFRGGVALGPFLRERFRIPVFLNNDGDLFVYGEAICGFLPYVNELLERAGYSRRYRNLFGITLGTGLGGGIVSDGVLLRGDNSAGGEAWLLRNRLEPEINAEEGASIRAVQRVYCREAGVDPARTPSPKEIFEIGMGCAEGDRAAACEAYRQLGIVAGDVLAQALTLIDGLAVIGGGLSAAAPLFMPALMGALNGVYERENGPLKRLIAHAFNLEDPADQTEFLRSKEESVAVHGSSRRVSFDPLPRTAVGLSRLGTSQAVSVGAYAFALAHLS
jgi:glucokinase